MSIKYIAPNSDKAIFVLATLTCADCGCTDEDMFVLPDGEIVCEDCLRAYGYVRCRECGELVPHGDAARDAVTEDYVCADCMDGDFAVCDECGCIVPSDSLIRVARGRRRDDLYLCEDCLDNSNYVECDTCYDYFDPDTCGHTDGYGNAECDDCYDRYDMVTCESCGEILSSDEYWCDDDEYHCSRCHDTWEANNHGSLHDYGYKPSPCFRGTDDHGLYMGVELEIDKGNAVGSCVSDLHGLTGDLYCKHDGSLNNGIEIVTHPCSLDYHRCNFPWEKVIETSRFYGFTSHDAGTCGLHVHVSRKALVREGDTNETAAGRVIVLVDRLWDYLDRFSRRNGNHRWAARTRTPKAWVDAESEREVLENVYALTTGSRYLAVNTLNTETVEFRFNRGSLEYDTILASIELCHNLVTYAREHSLNEITHATWEEVIAIGTDDGSNAELLRYCGSRMTGEYEPTELPEFHTPAATRVDIGSVVEYMNCIGVAIRMVGDQTLVYISIGDPASLLSEPNIVQATSLDELGTGRLVWIPTALLEARGTAVSGRFSIGDIVAYNLRRRDRNFRSDLGAYGIVIGRTYDGVSVYWPALKMGHSCDGLLSYYGGGWNVMTREVLYLDHTDDINSLGILA